MGDDVEAEEEVVVGLQEETSSLVAAVQVPFESPHALQGKVVVGIGEVSLDEVLPGLVLLLKKALSTEMDVLVSTRLGRSTYPKF